MRVLLSKKSKRELIETLKRKFGCGSISELSEILGFSKKTVRNWTYFDYRYLPKEIVPKSMYSKIEDEKEDNWGSVKGGREAINVIVKKYGKTELDRRRSVGGKRAAALREKSKGSVNVDITNPLFLEFYGNLLGDGWLSNYQYKDKKFWLIGLSGHSILDKKFFAKRVVDIKNLFNRSAYSKTKTNKKSIELTFSHKALLKYLNGMLDFPIGEKVGLKISGKIMKLGRESVNKVIRGIFDTDGSFYLDKTPSGNPYPCISIEMKAPLLIKQIYTLLIEQGFRVSYKKTKRGNQRITLKGRKQLSRWMGLIGSTNPRHLNKIKSVPG